MAQGTSKKQPMQEVVSALKLLDSGRFSEAFDPSDENTPIFLDQVSKGASEAWRLDDVIGELVPWKEEKEGASSETASSDEDGEDPSPHLAARVHLATDPGPETSLSSSGGSKFSYEDAEMWPDVLASGLDSVVDESAEESPPPASRREPHNRKNVFDQIGMSRKRPQGGLSALRLVDPVTGGEIAGFNPVPRIVPKAELLSDFVDEVQIDPEFHDGLVPASGTGFGEGPADLSQLVDMDDVGPPPELRAYYANGARSSSLGDASYSEFDAGLPLELGSALSGRGKPSSLSSEPTALAAAKGILRQSAAASGSTAPFAAGPPLQKNPFAAPAVASGDAPFDSSELMSDVPDVPPPSYSAAYMVASGYSNQQESEEEAVPGGDSLISSAISQSSPIEFSITGQKHREAVEAAREQERQSAHAVRAAELSRQNQEEISRIKEWSGDINWLPPRPEINMTNLPPIEGLYGLPHLPAGSAVAEMQPPSPFPTRQLDGMVNETLRSYLETRVRRLLPQVISEAIQDMSSGDKKE